MTPDHVILLGAVLFALAVFGLMIKSAYNDTMLMKARLEYSFSSIRKSQLENMRRLRGEVVKQPRAETRMDGFEDSGKVLFFGDADHDDKKTLT